MGGNWVPEDAGLVLGGGVFERLTVTTAGKEVLRLDDVEEGCGGGFCD